jgi:hypothetical protein
MSKRLITVGALLLIIPVIGLALLRIRTSAPAPAAEKTASQAPSGPSLPEAIADLQRRIDSGEVKLPIDDKTGYLRALLKELQILPSSQSLVFGKNSAQLFLISPETPRALYFNDDVYVGYVQGAPHIEFASMDPIAGPVFYTLDQGEAAKPQFKKEPTDCLACHDTFDSDKPVPRLLVLSTLSDPKGVALNRSAIVTNDKSPFIERWGGWYVTGTHGSQRHMGNRFVREPASSLGDMRKYAASANLNEGANLTDLSKRFDTTPYLNSHSDIVALMVLGHQTHIHNLITVASFSLRDKASDSDLKEKGEQLLKAMLFSEAVPLTEPVKGTTNFAAEFSALGPRDSKDRSLHQLDLKQRLLQYPLSYLIYSKSFDALPEAAHDYVYRRLWEVLSGKDQSKEFAHLSLEDRKTILEILQDTKPDFAEFVKKTQ